MVLRRLRRPSSRDRGFTLIELLVVVIVVGILAAIAIPVFLRQRQKAVEAGLKAEVRSLAQAQEAWLVDHPSEVGTYDLSALADNGYRHTPGNQVWIYLDTTKRGYALMARSTGDSKGGLVTWSVAYDSLSGGMVGGGRLAVWTDYITPQGAIPDNGNSWVKVYEN